MQQSKRFANEFDCKKAQQYASGLDLANLRIRITVNRPDFRPPHRQINPIQADPSRTFVGYSPNAQFPAPPNFGQFSGSHQVGLLSPPPPLLSHPNQAILAQQFHFAQHLEFGHFGAHELSNCLMLTNMFNPSE